MKYNLLELERITIYKDSSSKIKRWNLRALFSFLLKKWVALLGRIASTIETAVKVKSYRRFLNDPHNGQIARISNIF